VRRRLQHLLITTATAATVVGMASPANAALTVRAQWNMDSLPTMVDSAGGDNNGTTKNVTLSGGAYSFNGSTSMATAPDKANLDPGTANLKLSVRLSLTQMPHGNYDIVRKGTVTTPGGYYKIEIDRTKNGSAIAMCRVRDVTGRSGEVYGTANLAGKGFVTITCTKTSTGLTLTAGGKTTNTPRTLSSTSNSAPVTIGQKGDGTDQFSGLIDFVKIEIG
jgi:hypothetical protein